MAEEIKWEEFDRLRVVKRLREVIGKWWHIQINFTDKKGFLRGVPNGKFFNPLNPFLRLLHLTTPDCGLRSRST